MKAYILIFLLCAASTTLNGRTVELDVNTPEGVRCNSLSVLLESGDTLTRFDSLAFSGIHSCLFFDSPDSTLHLTLITADHQRFHSDDFDVSPISTMFQVHVTGKILDITSFDYKYPPKEGNKYAYFVFLLIFFAIKWLISLFFVRRKPSLMAVTAGAFLLTSLVAWNVSLPYLAKMLLIAALEWGIIFWAAHKNLSWFRTAEMIGVASIVGYGVIAFLYLSYFLW